MEWLEVVDLISGAGPAHMATADAHGRPHVSKVGVGIEDGLLWFATRMGSGKARNLLVNENVALVWEGNHAETYLSGTAFMFEDIPTKQHVWESGLLPFDPAGFFGSPENPDLIMVRITPTSVIAMVQGDEGLARHSWRP